VRKLVTFGLFFLFIWQIIGFVGCFEISHHHLKKEIKTLLKQGVPKDELIVFKFNENEMNQLIWLKKNEFDLNGNLYDVVRRHRQEDGIIYMECISDKQETVLFAKLGENIAINLGDDQHPTPLSNWLKILHFPIISLDNTIVTPVIISEESAKDVYNYLANQSIKSVRIDSPPPCFFS
jgi:hypothetical protein